MEPWVIPKMTFFFPQLVVLKVYLWFLRDRQINWLRSAPERTLYFQGKTNKHLEAKKTGILIGTGLLLGRLWGSGVLVIVPYGVISSQRMIQWCIIWVAFIAQRCKEQVVEKMPEFPLAHESNRKALCLRVPLRKCWTRHGRSPDVPGWAILNPDQPGCSAPGTLSQSRMTGDKHRGNGEGADGFETKPCTQ